MTWCDCTAGAWTCAICPDGQYAPTAGLTRCLSCAAIEGVACTNGEARSKEGYFIFQTDAVSKRVRATKCPNENCLANRTVGESRCAANRAQSDDNVLCGRCVCTQCSTCFLSGNCPADASMARRKSLVTV